jgi:hypothetical protein
MIYAYISIFSSYGTIASIEIKFLDKFAKVIDYQVTVRIRVSLSIAPRKYLKSKILDKYNI